MPYTPINADVYIAAYTGAIGGMTVGGGWIIDPLPADYNNVCKIAGAYAQQVDITWNDPSPLASLDYEKIQCISEQLFIQRGAQPAANTQFQTPSNWSKVAIGLLAAVQQADTFLTSQGIVPTPPGGGSGVRRARGVVIDPLPADLTQFELGGTGNDGIVYGLGDTILAIGEVEAPARTRSGPWVVSAINVDTIHGTLTRPSWWADGATLTTSGVPIEVGSEGGTYNNTRWRAMGPQTNGVVSNSTTADSFIVGTDDPGMYPEQLTTQVQLVGGESLLLPYPILGASTGIAVTDVHIRPATTGFYQVDVIPGDLGTGTAGVAVTAYTSAGVIDTTNGTSVNITINNQSLFFTS